MLLGPFVFVMACESETTPEPWRGSQQRCLPAAEGLAGGWAWGSVPGTVCMGWRAAESPASCCFVSEWSVAEVARCARPAPSAVEQPPDWPVPGEMGKQHCLMPIPVCKAAAFV